MNAALHALIARYSALYRIDFALFFLYGSVNQRITDVAGFRDACYIQADEKDTGYRTCVAVPYPLDQDQINRWNLVPLQ